MVREFLASVPGQRPVKFAGQSLRLLDQCRDAFGSQADRRQSRPIVVFDTVASISGVNASAGISYNKFLAKLASDHRMGRTISENTRTALAAAKARGVSLAILTVLGRSEESRLAMPMPSPRSKPTQLSVLWTSKAS